VIRAFSRSPSLRASPGGGWGRASERPRPRGGAEPGGWRVTWDPTPVFLPGESRGQRRLVSYSLWFRKESDRTEHSTPLPFSLQSRSRWARAGPASSEFSEWLRLLPFLGVLALLGYLAVRPFLPKKKQQKDSLINLKIQKENPKVVNEINIEDLCLTKAAYCRCWRSKTFPACDGSHNKHNELTGDNVGPLILKKKEV
uniref:Uncharacterized protein n=1 Tax=Ovis aries TaxID=9940 RepID=A0AC11BE31_SHEEP